MIVEWNPPINELLDRHAKKVPVVVKDVLMRLGALGQAHAKRLTPVDTGRLRKSITWFIPGKPEVHIGSNVVYAPIILGDTPPFVIVAVHGRGLGVLAWVDKGHVRPSTKLGWKIARAAGIAHFARAVRHPGGKDILGKTERHLETKYPVVIPDVLRKHGITG